MSGWKSFYCSITNSVDPGGAKVPFPYVWGSLINSRSLLSVHCSLTFLGSGGCERGNVLCGLVCFQDLCRGSDAHGTGKSKPSTAVCHAYQRKKGWKKLFNYSRPASWKGFQDSELGMRHSFVGTLLSPPPLPALGRRVDYMSMEKRKKSIFFSSRSSWFLFILFLLAGKS